MDKLLIIIWCCTFNFQLIGQVKDSDYGKFKKEADLLFNKGDYENARKNYALCIGEKENDEYAISKLNEATLCRDLVTKAKALSLENKTDEAVPLLLEILKINPKDTKIQAKHWEYWSIKPLELLEKGDFEAAKHYFEESKSLPYPCDICNQKLKIIERYESNIAKADSATGNKEYKKAIIYFYAAKKYYDNCVKCTNGIKLANEGIKENEKLEDQKKKEFIIYWTAGQKIMNRGIFFEYSEPAKHTAYMCQAIKHFNSALVIAENCSTCQAKVPDIKNAYIPECEGFEKSKKDLNKMRFGTLVFGLATTSIGAFSAIQYKNEQQPNQKTNRNLAFTFGSILLGVRILINNAQPEKINCN